MDAHSVRLPPSFTNKKLPRWLLPRGAFLLYVREKEVRPLLKELAPLLQQVITLVGTEDGVAHRVHQALLGDDEVLLVAGAPVGESGADAVERERLVFRRERGRHVRQTRGRYVRTPPSGEEMLARCVQALEQALRLTRQRHHVWDELPVLAPLRRNGERQLLSVDLRPLRLQVLLPAPNRKDSEEDGERVLGPIRPEPLRKAT